jgi:anaerobic selenocysteine-containing dehydrogenase
MVIKRPKPGEPPEKEATEGVETEQLIATSCLNCPTRCAINVRVVNGKAVRISGNPNSAYTKGKTCPRSHVGLQVLYNPDRFKTTPLRRKTGSAKGRETNFENDFYQISWDEAIGEIAEKLKSISPEKLLVLQGLNTTSNEDLICQFAGAYGTNNLFHEERLETDADRKGKQMADGRDNSGYELQSQDGTSTKYILAFGAGIVESERPLARNLHLWGELRRGTPNRNRVVVVDPRYSVTAAKADEWIPINPGTEGALAMAIANVIISEGPIAEEFVNDYTSGFANYEKVATSARFSPENVAKITGVDAKVIRRVAREFAQSKPAVAWSGEAATSWPYGSYTSHAIFCLNALVGSINVPGGIVYQEYPDYRPFPLLAGEPGIINFRRLGDLIQSKSIQAAVGFNSNLIMSVPESKKWEEALKNSENLPYYVHIGPARNEMAAYADIILPSCTYLEEWGYESALPGSGYAEARIKQPVLSAPLYESRAIARIMFDLAEEMGAPVADPFMAISDNADQFAEEFVRYRTGTLKSWDDFRRDGVWEGPDYEYEKWTSIFDTPSGKFEFQSTHLEKLLNVKLPGEDTEHPFMLAIYRPVLEIRSGTQNIPWAQEMFLVMHGRGWDNLVEMNREAADEFGIGDGDTVLVESEFGEIKAKARVFEGILPGAVAIATGQGHYASGRWTDGIGVNPNEIIGTEYDEESGQPSFFSTRVSVRKA